MRNGVKPYECFRCRDNGFPKIMVNLAGKDDQGKTIYIEDDRTGRRHKTKDSQQSATSSSQTEQNLGRLPSEKIIIAMLEGINKKLDRFSGLLESHQQIDVELASENINNTIHDYM
jgi:hypothetical protein